MQVTISINGEPVTREIEPALLLVHFIRDTPGLTGTHWGCDTSNCGACVVQMDGRPVKSCTVLAAMAEGHEIRTIESLEVDGVLDPVQQGFHEEHGLQCGFCTPGMIMTARALLDANPDPSEEEIRRRSRARSAAAPDTRTSSERSAGRPSTRPPQRAKELSMATTTTASPESPPIGYGRMKRKEDARFIRGQGKYLDDIVLPGMLHGAVLRSPYAHAKIVSIDASARRSRTRRCCA